MNDSLPQEMCSACINLTNETYKFRKKCQDIQKSLTDILKNTFFDIKIGIDLRTDTKPHSIDISNLINECDSVTLSEYNLELEENSADVNTMVEIVLDEPTEKNRKKTRTKERKPVKRILKKRKTDKEKKEREKEEIECEYCHKILTSKLSLRNHYKIHTGFDVVCEVRPDF